MYATADGKESGGVFINANSVDRASAQKIGKGIDQRFAWMLPLSLAKTGARPEEVLEDLQENLINADGIIIMYGAVGPAWVAQQLRLYRKLAPRRKRPPRLLALVTAPPLPKPPISIGLPRLVTIEIDALPRVLEQTLLQ